MKTFTVLNKYIKLSKLIILLAFGLSLFQTSDAFSLEYFTNFVSTKSWIDYAGTITIDENNTKPGDEIAVFVSNGQNEEILVGAAKIGTTSQEYYIIHIFQDDTLTQQKDGAKRDDLLHFKYWQKITNTVCPILTTFMTHESKNGLSSHEIPPVFKPGPMGIIYGQLNINMPEFPPDYRNGKVNLINVIQLLQYLAK
ncbi:MAG: hypothetical protein HQK75_08435 [Candidatus Magnetomorum sp.]|nr:hypothetical protein [Candidatus Magnetomorum sp.]